MWRRNTLLWWGWAVACLAGAGCVNYRALNEANPEFRRAEAARQAGEFDAAIAAYRECLRLAPGSYQAHLQLAMIFDSQKQDLPQAITHYEAYLAAPGAENPETVRHLLNLAKAKYLKELQTAMAPPAAPISVLPLPRSKAELQALPAPRVATVPLADAAAPPATATPPPAPAPARTYVVAPGDTLTKISRQFYGSGNHWQRIFDANRNLLPTAEKLEPGQTLVIPPSP
jgi:LysM repeat protein